MAAGSEEEWVPNMSGFAELSEVESIQKKNCKRRFAEDECFIYGDHPVTHRTTRGLLTLILLS